MSKSRSRNKKNHVYIRDEEHDEDSSPPLRDLMLSPRFEPKISS